MNLYPMKDFGPIIYYLKLNVMRDKKARIIYFTQIAAIDRILKKIKMIKYSFCTIFMKSGLQFEGIQNSSQIVN
jgi:hypothetical protein